jgi:hypothetical protein
MRDVIYHDRPRVSPARKAIRICAALIAAAVILLLGVILFTRMDLDMNRQAVESLRNNVTEACVQCYAIEGAYPSNIHYLEQNYGVRYDGAKYAVSLDAGAKNELPAVQITLRR